MTDSNNKLVNRGNGSVLQINLTIYQCDKIVNLCSKTYSQLFVDSQRYLDHGTQA